MVLAHRTRFGTDVFALGRGEDTAWMMGVAVGRTTVLIDAFSGLMAGLAGIAFAGLHGRGLAPSPRWGWSSTPSPPW